MFEQLDEHGHPSGGDAGVGELLVDRECQNQHLARHKHAVLDDRLVTHRAHGEHRAAARRDVDGHLRDAVPPAHQAVESDPGRPEYWTTLARAYEGAGATAEATLAYAEAAKRSPSTTGTPAPGSATPANGTTTPGDEAGPTGSATPGIAATAEAGTTPGANVTTTVGATTTAGATGTATATPAGSLLAPAGAGTVVPAPSTPGAATATATTLPAPSGIR